MGKSIALRTLEKRDYPLMQDFLYEAIFVPEGMQRPPREVVRLSELAMYVEGFGARSDDNGMVAEVAGRVVGMAWVRVIDDYGHIDDNTPSLAIAVMPDYRGRGIGTALLEALFAQLQAASYEAVSLSVQLANPALRLYERLGFVRVREACGEAVMRRALEKNM